MSKKIDRELFWSRYYTRKRHSHVVFGVADRHYFRLDCPCQILWWHTSLALGRISIEDVTQWREDMKFMLEWRKQYLTNERSEQVRYCSCHENIKFISSSSRVMFFLLYRHADDGVLIIFRRFPTTFWRFPKILGSELHEETTPPRCFRCHRSTPFPFGLSLANFMVTHFSSPGEDLHRGYYTVATRYEFYMFEWQKQYLTSVRSERVRYSSSQENIKFISSS